MGSKRSAPKKARAGRSLPQARETFGDARCAQLFETWKTNKKSIIMESIFNPAVEDGDLRDQIASRSWFRLCNPEDAANESVVYEFYANARFFKDDDKVTVRGVEVSFSKKTISEHFRLPVIENDDYYRMLNEGPDYELIMREMGPPGAQWTYSLANASKPVNCSMNVFNRYAKAWCRFINTNLQPSSQHTEITTDRVVLLYCICKGLSINIPAVIYNSILHIANGTTNAALGFGSLITTLCAAAGVQMNEEEPTVYLGNIDTARINRWEEWYRYGVRPSGLGWEIDPADPNLPPPPTPLLPRVRGREGSIHRDMRSNENQGVRSRAEARGERHAGASSSAPGPSTEAPAPPPSEDPYSMPALGMYLHAQFSSIHDHISYMENRQSNLAQHLHHLEAFQQQLHPTYEPLPYPDSMWNPYPHPQPPPFYAPPQPPPFYAPPPSPAPDPTVPSEHMPDPPNE